MRMRAAILSAMLVAGTSALAQTTLKDAYKDDFVIGAALNADEITGKDSLSDAIVTAQLNAISPENVLKWEAVHPRPDAYDFTLADQYVRFGMANHMYIVGHTLVWHNQTPDWVFHDVDGNLLTRDELLKRLRDHVMTVVGRYKGQIKSWDVVNEALNEDGTLRHSMWYKIIGPDYIEKAFQYAHEADPDAKLNYNDYSLENPPKRQGALDLVAKLKSEGIQIDCVGLQGHYNLTWPSIAQTDETIAAFGRLGVNVAITELDMDVLPPASNQNTADVTLDIAQNPALNPYANGLPDDVQQQLAARYGALFAVFLKHKDVVNRVTLWGVTDAQSWRNDWPVKGRTAYPLLFDRDGKPKPAYDAVIKAAGE